MNISHYFYLIIGLWTTVNCYIELPLKGRKIHLQKALNDYLDSRAEIPVPTYHYVNLSKVPSCVPITQESINNINIPELADENFPEEASQDDMNSYIEALQMRRECLTANVVEKLDKLIEILKLLGKVANKFLQAQSLELKINGWAEIVPNNDDGIEETKTEMTEFVAQIRIWFLDNRENIKLGRDTGVTFGSTPTIEQTDVNAFNTMLQNVDTHAERLKIIGFTIDNLVKIMVENWRLSHVSDLELDGRAKDVDE